MDWSGIATAYTDLQRKRLGVPSREALATKRAEEARRDALIESQIESAEVRGEYDRARMAALPAEQEMTRRLREAQIRNYDEQPRAAAGTEFERFVALPPEKQAEILRLRKSWGTADDRPPSTTILPYIVSDGAGGRTVIDRRTGQPIPGISPAPTAEMTNRVQAQKRAVPVLTDLGSRILSMNKGSEGGFLARAGGLGRRVAGGVGIDSAADLYTTGVRGFVPLIARSVGHVGVLTELDVKRTEDLFPRIGDAEDVTQEKLARLERIVTGQEPMPFEFERPEYDDRGITQAPNPAAPPPAAPGAPPPGAPPAKPPGATTTVRTPQDYAALPAGTVYFGPDGKRRKKP